MYLVILCAHHYLKAFLFSAYIQTVLELVHPQLLLLTSLLTIYPILLQLSFT